jgi:hypothetical protein
MLIGQSFASTTQISESISYISSSLPIEVAGIFIDFKVKPNSEVPKTV